MCPNRRKYVELGVVVVQDVEVREPLSVRHQPAHGVRDVQRRVVTAEQPRFDPFRRLFRLVDRPLEPARDQPQDRPGCGVAQLHHALRGDLHPPDPAVADVDAVGAAVVDDRPTAVFDNDDGVPAGHPDVRRRRRHTGGRDRPGKWGPAPGAGATPPPPPPAVGRCLPRDPRPPRLPTSRSWTPPQPGRTARRQSRPAPLRDSTRPVPTRASARPPPMAMTGAARLPSHFGKDPLAGW